MQVNEEMAMRAQMQQQQGMQPHNMMQQVNLMQGYPRNGQDPLMQPPPQNERGPLAQPHQAKQRQQAVARDKNRPPFKNPFKDALPQGSYGKREYVPGQEKIRVSGWGERGDDPWVGWGMMQALNQLRKRNGG
jgi:hypothetical protein